MKSEKNKRDLSVLKEELTKLKTFALLFVKDLQRLGKLLEDQQRDVKYLTTIAAYIEPRICAARAGANVQEVLKFLRWSTAA